MLFDSHTHINNETYSQQDREALIQDIEASDLSYVCDIGFDLASSVQAVKDAAENSWCYAAVGVHPSDTGTMDEDILTMIEGLTKKPKVVAIGEIGLDYYYEDTDRETQQIWFRRQIQLANKLKMPIIIHTRDADEDTMQILKEEGAFSTERASWFPKRKVSADGATDGVADGATDGVTDGATVELPDCRVLMHCFSSSKEIARQYVKLGATISIAGPVTFKNNRRTTEVVQEIPIELLLVETDAPYLTPEPHRGKPNKAPYVEYTARRVAVIKGMDYEEVARITCENAKRFFGI